MFRAEWREKGMEAEKEMASIAKEDIEKIQIREWRTLI